MVKSCTEILKYLANLSQDLSPPPHWWEAADQRTQLCATDLGTPVCVACRTSGNVTRQRDIISFTEQYCLWHASYLSFTYTKFIIYVSKRLVTVNCVFPELPPTS